MHIYKIIWIVRPFWLVHSVLNFHSTMKHENDLRALIDGLQVVRIYSFIKEIKLFKRTSYIVFLFVILLKK